MQEQTIITKALGYKNLSAIILYKAKTKYRNTKR